MSVQRNFKTHVSDARQNQLLLSVIRNAELSNIDFEKVAEEMRAPNGDVVRKRFERLCEANQYSPSAKIPSWEQVPESVDGDDGLQARSYERVDEEELKAQADEVEAAKKKKADDAMAAKKAKAEAAKKRKEKAEAAKEKAAKPSKKATSASGKIATAADRTTGPSTRSVSKRKAGGESGEGGVAKKSRAEERERNGTGAKTMAAENGEEAGAETGMEDGGAETGAETEAEAEVEA